MVLDLDGEPLDRRVHRRPLRHRPGAHRRRRPRAAGRSGARSPACSWTTKTPALTPRTANCSWPSTLTALDLHLGDPRRRADPRAGTRRSSSTAGSGPSAWTSTLPSSPLRTQPITPSSPRPAARVASRKPTPCTSPRTTARIAACFRVRFAGHGLLQASARLDAEASARADQARSDRQPDRFDPMNSSHPRSRGRLRRPRADHHRFGGARRATPRSP